jgi:hypothetical protein
MDIEFSETSSRSLATIHGFRVQSYGRRLSPGFKRGLRRLAERGFDDPTCVVVKTANGSRSGITHAGGRYVHPNNTYRREVVRQMRELGMEPPPAPFIIAPGEYTLYHEWGHHVDRTWSGDSQEILFSFRWLSRFYRLGVRPSIVAHDELRPIESDAYASDAVVVWWHASSELFADLFEDWIAMRIFCNAVNEKWYAYCALVPAYKKPLRPCSARWTSSRPDRQRCQQQQRQSTWFGNSAACCGRSDVTLPIDTSVVEVGCVTDTVVVEVGLAPTRQRVSLPIKREYIEILCIYDSVQIRVAGADCFAKSLGLTSFG